MICLREVRETDLLIFFAQQNDPEANRMAVLAARNQAAFDQHWAKILSRADVVTKTIEVDRRVAGHIVCWEKDPGFRCFGYWLGREYWGRGIASQAVAEFIKTYSHRPLHAYAVDNNTRSQRILAKCGFKRTAKAKLFSAFHGYEVDETLFVLD